MSKDVFGFDINFLKQLKSLMQETNIEEIEIEEGKERYIRISRKKQKAEASSQINFVTPQMQYMQAPQAINMPAQSGQSPTASPVKQTSTAPAISKYDDDSKYFKIKSPVIGTYYESPSPDAPPFVKVGDNVTPDTTVCIVEAMKVMNEIKADCKGKILEVLKSNSNPVQSNEVLFVIEKA